jgi:hypothetical protein
MIRDEEFKWMIRKSTKNDSIILGGKGSAKSQRGACQLRRFQAEYIEKKGFAKVEMISGNGS